MMFDYRLNRQCDTLGKCFILSGKDTWATRDFVRKLFKTELGQKILRGIPKNEYSSEGFMYEGLLRELHKREGKTYPELVLWYAGYLYRYIVATSNKPLEEIFYKADIDILEARYGFYHTQDWDYIREDLGL